MDLSKTTGSGGSDMHDCHDLGINGNRVDVPVPNAGAEPAAYLTEGHGSEAGGGPMCVPVGDGDPLRVRIGAAWGVDDTHSHCQGSGCCRKVDGAAKAGAAEGEVTSEGARGAATVAGAGAWALCAPPHCRTYRVNVKMRWRNER
eukprot:GHVU01205843.1.p1 GENE.GHVU01205843.1~~GHVU01205843.1.p1  ORF type:complete len:145 (-),score=21.77 GHVU01205843.1:311-745(-)